MEIIIIIDYNYTIYNIMNKLLERKEVKMKKEKKNLFICGGLILLAIIYTCLVKVVDVQPVGAEGSNIGFATINKFVFDNIGFNKVWYDITEILGYVPILFAGIYGLVGVSQLIKRKSLKKVDNELICLALFYVVVVALYVFFEKVIINYRPVILDEGLEASYPSSHTLMSICLCGSSILINKKLFNNKYTNVMNIINYIIIAVIVVGRLISGVHWVTDILGGIIISSALLKTFKYVINNLKNN